MRVPQMGQWATGFLAVVCLLAFTVLVSQRVGGLVLVAVVLSVVWDKVCIHRGPLLQSFAPSPALYSGHAPSPAVSPLLPPSSSFSPAFYPTAPIAILALPFHPPAVSLLKRHGLLPFTTWSWRWQKTPNRSGLERHPALRARGGCGGERSPLSPGGPILHTSGEGGHDGHATDDTGYGSRHQPDNYARRKDWYCPCRQYNWHSRDSCYKCGIPRGTDSPSGTAQQGAVLPAKDGTKSTANAEDQPKGSNANKEDANQPADPK